jgi:hypothetical protein
LWCERWWLRLWCERWWLRLGWCERWWARLRCERWWARSAVAKPRCGVAPTARGDNARASRRQLSARATRACARKARFSYAQDMDPLAD